MAVKDSTATPEARHLRMDFATFRFASRGSIDAATDASVGATSCAGTSPPTRSMASPRLGAGGVAGGVACSQ